MTPEELAAIKDRAEWAPGVAPDSPLAAALDARRAWLADPSGPPPPEVDNLWLWYDDAAKDRQRLLDALSEVEAVYQAEVARLRKEIEDDALAEDTGGPWPDGMCPNCVTPWKCNGPHVVECD